MMRTSVLRVAALAMAGAIVMPGCSIHRFAVNRVGDALAAGSSCWARDDDPELVRDAAPFGLKTIESLIEESPRHRGLLLAAARGFTQYAFAFVQQDADELESQDLERALEMRGRAVRLYLRARDYGLRGLDVSVPGAREEIVRDPAAVLAKMRRSDVPMLYWTAMAWGAAISLDKANAELTSDLGTVELLMRRALELDESFDAGAIHDFYISWEGARPAAAGGSTERAREHLDRALALAGGARAAPLVTFAETVSVAAQNRQELTGLLEKARAVDPAHLPDQRLANVIYQRRARWLLSRADELFLE